MIYYKPYICIFSPEINGRVNTLYAYCPPQLYLWYDKPKTMSIILNINRIFSMIKLYCQAGLKVAEVLKD